MKRDKVLSMAVTSEEQQALLNLLRSKESKLGKRLTVSDFLRDLLHPYLNGSPSQETPQETTKDNQWDQL